VNSFNKYLSRPTCYCIVRKQTQIGGIIPRNSPVDHQVEICLLFTRRYTTTHSPETHGISVILLRNDHGPLHFYSPYPLCYCSIEKPNLYLLKEDCVDSALKLSNAAFDSPLLPDPFLDSARAAAPVKTLCEDYVRLVLCGSGAFRATQFQAIMTLASELLARLTVRSQISLV
jgi:hypothetical protein